MSALKAITGARIFDAERWHDNAALFVAGGHIVGVVQVSKIPADAEIVALPGGSIVPGFIDLQVNGGGGALLNDVPTLAGIRTICAAHARFGTTALLPTLITDTPAITDAAVDAGIAAAVANVPGFLGLHLEGPHLSIARKGAHDPALIRLVEASDIARFRRARMGLPNLLLTVAAETVPPAQIAELVALGAIVSVGHSDAGVEQVGKAVAAGATMVTHLFNAQSQISNREPGVVGAALAHGEIFAGLIADGIHVHPQTIALALRAKTGPGRIFLVTDAMSLTGTDQQSFTLNGREILRANGALRLADGTLAGADLTMIDAVHYVHQTIGLDWDEALRMAALYPARAMGIEATHGHLHEGAVANFVHLANDGTVAATWIDGAPVYNA